MVVASKRPLVTHPLLSPLAVLVGLVCGSIKSTPLNGVVGAVVKKVGWFHRFSRVVLCCSGLFGLPSVFGGVVAEVRNISGA